MKKIFFICVVLLSVVALSLDNDEFRIRIIANSNSEYDQQLKMKIAEEIDEIVVKNNITKYNIMNYEYAIRTTIERYTNDYEMEIVKEKFPTKSINNTLSKSGYYDSLVIKLSSGSGENYFSVLYPDYYGISYEDVKTGKVEYKSWFYETFKSLFN